MTKRFGGGGGGKKSKVAFQSSLYFGQDCFVDKTYYFLNLDKYYIQRLLLSFSVSGRELVVTEIVLSS